MNFAHLNVGPGNTVGIKCCIPDNIYYLIFAVIIQIKSEYEFTVSKWSRYHSNENWDIVEFDCSQLDDINAVIESYNVHDVILADEPNHLFDEIGIL